MSDYVYGDKIGRDKNVQNGSNNNFTVNNSQGLSAPELDAAISELRSFVAQLTRDGVVAADGSVTDPGAVVAAVQSQPGRLQAVGRAVAGGAEQALLSAVQGGVAALIAALVGRA
ncbi:hypothetical protein [Streptomyces olivochromogenes]|uniref:hypothetical protein n=1 Tax=Streptomyces olivochromogenes TaxID=1963 RepID=UPI001F19AB43|nr:hypothetical protein [Streptomyces olivochromogenes]MCF3135068.1 hypothetical protein [Streptomyces olivochromogenes]